MTDTFKKLCRIGTIPTYPGSGRRVSVFIEIRYELKKDRGVLSISGVIGPNKWGNAAGGCGQIEMEFDHKDKSQNDPRYDHPVTVADFNFAPGWTSDHWWKLLDIWHKWHLNDLHSECVHQEVLGWTYNTHAGQHCPECDYQIGTAWTYRPIPDEVLTFLQNLPYSDKPYPWSF